MYTSKEVYEYISRKTSDPIVERKICRISGTEFPIYQSDLDFYAKISPTFDGQKFGIPTPTLCPEERQRRRLSFRNERKLYKRRCDATGEQIISMYSPDKDIKVYNLHYWRSDARDAKEYGQDFDFSKTFSSQFQSLMSCVPRFNLSNDNTSENSAYVNETTYQKNCYFTFDADQDEDCMFSNSIKFSKNCLDGTNVYYCEQGYALINCTKCSNSSYCIECESSSYLTSCTNCKDCHFCFGCEHLINKSYYINNKPCSSKQDYLTQLTLIQQYGYYRNKNIKQSVYQIQSEGSLGNNLAYTKNCILSYNFGNCENTKYSTCLNDTKNSLDFDIWGINCDYIYEGVTVGENAYNMMFNIMCWGNTKNLLYCYHCFACSDCFGCVALKNQQYCIFNKQYSKEEYEIMVAKIIEHMMLPQPSPPAPLPKGEGSSERGEFFHPSLSPFGYNETVAMEYFPVEQTPSPITSVYPPYQGDKIDFGVETGKSMLPPGEGRGTACGGRFEKLHEHGYHRSFYSSDPKIPEGVTTLQGAQVPGDISTVTDDICKKIILCEVSNRPYMIQKAELEFYRKHSISLPRKHPDIRHEERMQLRPGRTLFLRNCDKCGEEMLSVYEVPGNLTQPLQREEHGHQQKVYCEKCYQKEVYA